MPAPVAEQVREGLPRRADRTSRARDLTASSFSSDGTKRRPRPQADRRPTNLDAIDADVNAGRVVVIGPSRIGVRSLPIVP